MQTSAVSNRRSKQAGRQASTQRVYATSPKLSDSFRYLLFRAQYPTTKLINPARRRRYQSQSCTRMRQTCTYLITGNFTILSIIPSSYRKKNTRFRVFRECNMDFLLCVARTGLKSFFYFYST